MSSMYFAYWMVLAASILPYAAAAYAKRGDVDNHAPRLSLEALAGPRQRADWAQRNHFESFPIFAAGVIIASIAGAPHATIDWLAGIHVILRILYTIAYITDRSTLRSVLFILGALCVLGLFAAAGFA
jgi:uncharacterized MAPEG superfamily protein